MTCFLRGIFGHLNTVWQCQHHMCPIRTTMSVANSPLVRTSANTLLRGEKQTRKCVCSRLQSRQQSTGKLALLQRSTTIQATRRAEPATATVDTSSSPVRQTSRGCDCPVRCSNAAARTSADAMKPQSAATPSDPSGPVLLTAGALVCSFISLQIKLFDDPLPPLQVTAFSSAVAWLATSIILKSSGMSTTLGCQARRMETVSLLMLRGLLAATTVVCYYSSIELLPLSVAVALFFFHPVICVVLDALVTGRLISRTALGSCLLTVLGVLTIGWHDQVLWYIEHMGQAAQGAPPGADLPVSGVLLGLAAAAANAAAFVCVGVVGPGVSPLCLTWWQHLVVAHVAVAAIIAGNLGPLEFRINSSSFGSEISSLFSSSIGSSSAGATGMVAASSPITSSLVMQFSEALSSLLVDASDAFGDFLDVLPSRHDAQLLLGVVTANFCGQLLLNAGFQRMEAGRGAAINTSQVLFGCIWDVTLLHSAPSMATWVGASAIAAGVCGSTLSKQDSNV